MYQKYNINITEMNVLFEKHEALLNCYWSRTHPLNSCEHYYLPIAKKSYLLFIRPVHLH